MNAPAARSWAYMKCVQNSVRVIGPSDSDRRRGTGGWQVPRSKHEAVRITVPDLPAANLSDVDPLTYSPKHINVGAMSTEPPSSIVLRSARGCSNPIPTEVGDGARLVPADGWFPGINQVYE